MATGLIGEKAGAGTRSTPAAAFPACPAAARGGRAGRVQPQRAQPARRPARPADARPPPRRRRLGPGSGWRAARPAGRSRTPFVLLLVGLLGGGLVCLLLINTTLAEGSFQITAMQQKNAALAQQEQALQQETAQLEAPASIAARARQLGMRPVGRLRFLDLKNGRIYSQPATEPGVATVPGYTP